MVKASALYIVIIIALVIGLLCAALIASAYFYQATYQQKSRYDRLNINLQSGMNILVAGDDTSFLHQRSYSLFDSDQDSVNLKRINWGLFDVGVAEAFIQKDTLYKTFTVGRMIDSTKWAALYLIDEDRLLSVSGKTTIRGNAFLPKAGVKEAYVDNKAYQGNKKLVLGKKLHSEKVLPLLDTTRLKRFTALKKDEALDGNNLLKLDSVSQAFRLPTKVFTFKKQTAILQNIKISGNVVLLSDTTLTLDSSAHLNNVIVYARSLKVNAGFHGTCQLFATDTLTIEKDCSLDYPSAVGVFRFKTGKLDPRIKVSIGEKCRINGTVFSYEKADNKVPPLIQIGKNTAFTGQVYSQGALELTDNDVINGSVFTSRFLYRNNFTLFENYLINVTIDSRALSPYYLSSSLTPVSSKRKKTLQWLESN